MAQRARKEELKGPSCDAHIYEVMKVNEMVKNARASVGDSASSHRASDSLVRQRSISLRPPLPSISIAVLFWKNDRYGSP